MVSVGVGVAVSTTGCGVSVCVSVGSAVAVAVSVGVFVGTSATRAGVGVATGELSLTMGSTITLGVDVSGNVSGNISSGVLAASATGGVDVAGALSPGKWIVSGVAVAVGSPLARSESGGVGVPSTGLEGSGVRVDVPKSAIWYACCVSRSSAKRVARKSGVGVMVPVRVAVGVGVGPNVRRACRAHNIPPRPKSIKAATKRLIVMISALRLRGGQG